MATTIAHRQHIHVPLTPIIAVLATAVVAAAVLILINQPATTSTLTETQAGVATAAQAVAVPRPETPALRQQVAVGTVQVGTASEPFAYPRNHAQGTTMDPASSHVLAPPAPTSLPGNVADPHSLNHFAGQPR